MTKSMLFTTLAAATLAFGLAACDAQQATDQSTPPTQQHGAVPPTYDSGSRPTAPTAPQGTETPTAPGSDMPSMTPPPEEPETKQEGKCVVRGKEVQDREELGGA